MARADSTPGASDPGAESTPTRLRVDGRETRRPGQRMVTEPASRTPRLSWTVPLCRSGQEQRGWEVRIDPVDGGEGRVESGAGSDPFMRAPTLESRSQYQWCVRVVDENEEWSAWSTCSSIETGPFDYEEWAGGWTTQTALSSQRVAFELGSAPRSARLRIAAQGLARVELNGAPVNGEATDPSRTDYVRALYRCYDVTDLVHRGDNIWDVTLAAGDWEHSGTDPRLLAELVIDTADGLQQRWSPLDARWEAPSQVVIAERFYLERQDCIAPREFTGIRPVEALRVTANPGSPLDAPSAVTSDDSEPVRNVIRLHPVEMARIGGARIFDVGVNIAGRVELVVVTSGARGTIRMVHGEHLAAGGRVDTTSLTLPTDQGRVRQATEYVLSGEEGQLCTPWFSYHGFRYVEVSGLDDDVDVEVTAWTHHSDLDLITSLETDSPVITRLMERAERTLLNNVHSIPEDCPTREQAGWTGDTASVTEFEFSMFAMEAFFRKWLGDLRSSQRADGSIPAIAPQVGENNTATDPVWGAALQRVLIGHWRHYGDRAVVDATLPALRRWADFQLSCRGRDGVVSESPISYGHDWLALHQTPPALHHTNATIDCLDVLAELEDLGGETVAAARRRSEADDLRTAGRAFFFDGATGAFANGSQGALAIGLMSRMLTGEEVAPAVKALVHDIRERGDRVSSGFATTRTLVRALAHHGESEIVMATLSQPNEPGIGAMLDHGPGTFWECWWIDPSNAGTGSLDHIGLGGPFAAWALQTLAGVAPTAAGFARFDVKPVFVEGIDRVRLTTDTVRGTVAVGWERREGRLLIDIEVPVSAEADVVLDGGVPLILRSGRHRMIVDAPSAIRRDAAPRRDAAAEAGPAAAVLGRYRSVALPAADVSGGADWLALPAETAATTARGAAIEVLPDGISCMPIPHEQPVGPVVRVVGTHLETEEAPRIRIAFVDPQDLTRARFVWASVDLCLENTARPFELVIEVFGSDGTSVAALARTWPAGWNRVAIDVAEWVGRSAVTAVEVGLAYTGDPVASTGHAPAFQLGGVGYSAVARTW